MQCRALHHCSFSLLSQLRQPGPCTAEKAAALHSLGPDYQSAFSAAESSAVLEQAGPAAAAVLEGRDALGPRLLAAYNAQVLDPVDAALLSRRLASTWVLSCFHRM